MGVSSSSSFLILSLCPSLCLSVSLKELRNAATVDARRCLPLLFFFSCVRHAVAAMDALELLDRSPADLDRYSVLKYLGSGATADVFQVLLKSNRRAYVLKQMPLANMSDEEKLRAKQEILVMDGVDHPNVVKFHESFSSDSSVDIVMEYCEGGTLEQLIERQRYEGNPFPEDVLIEWMAELLCALAHIHSKRILHRDLKTGNIFVTEKNHLKLGDFGVCTILTNANAKAESMIGTPLYFAPEVCENDAYDERSDVWSLGIVFYEMCTLRRPFEADNLFSLIQNILTQEVAPFKTGLDISFEEIVRKMLSKDPNDRPTAQELIDDHLNVPNSHPSHPSQKPSRSRLVQQYYGPELKYTKPWPPPPSSEARDSRKAGHGKSAQLTKGPQEERGASIRMNHHNDAEDYINDERDRQKYTQMLNQTMGASWAAPFNASASASVVAPDSERQRSSTSGPTKAKATAVRPGTTTTASKTATSSKARKQLGSSSSVKAKTTTGSRAAKASCSLSSSQMDELKMDLAQRRSELFGEKDALLSSVPVVLEIPLTSMNDDETTGACSRSMGSYTGGSATVRSSSSFLDDIANVLERHTMHGRQIKLEELDDAVQLLSQYKLTNHGLY